MSDTVSTSRRTPVQWVALIVGIAFLLVGVAGFVPGLTTGLGGLTFAGMGSGAMLLGLFQVSVLHNVVHLLFGVVGVLLSRSARGARGYLLIGGAVYLVLWIYGLVTGMGAADFVPLNTADDWLHFGLGAAMVVLGLAVARHAVAVTSEERVHQHV